ncbi:MAG: hypothetical protein M5U34_33515 [Chloroflexi bacterium]|nr:hypothetical protein [Chloroflexota bacterium]
MAVTEINGRYYRLLSSGNSASNPLNTYSPLISLRTQERHVTGLSVTTKDGHQTSPPTSPSPSTS